MIKLKDLLFEKVAHTKKSLEWVSMDFIPMSPKVMQQIMGDTPITTFHNLNPDSVKTKLSKVIGKKKSISTYTKDTEGHLLQGGGIQTGGCVVLEIEGKVYDIKLSTKSEDPESPLPATTSPKVSEFFLNHLF